MSEFTLWAVSYLSDGTEVLAGKYISSDQAEQAKQTAEGEGHSPWITEELWKLGPEGATQIDPGVAGNGAGEPAAILADHQAAALWSQLTGSLARALSTLKQRQSISLHAGDLWVQFRALENGFHADAVSSGYLDDDRQLTPAQDEALQDLGWLPPIDADNIGRAENYYQDYSTPVPYADIAALGVRSLTDVYGVTYPQELHYIAIDSGEKRDLSFPELGIAVYQSDDEAVGALTDNPLGDVQDLLLEAIQTIDPDAEGWDEDDVLTIQFRSVLISFRVVNDPPIIRVSSPVLTGVTESVHLLRELNDINNQANFARLSLTADGTILVAYELGGLPFVSKHALSSIASVGQLADSLVQRLRVRHGGTPDNNLSEKIKGATRGVPWAPRRPVQQP